MVVKMDAFSSFFKGGRQSRIPVFIELVFFRIDLLSYSDKIRRVMFVISFSSFFLYCHVSEDEPVYQSILLAIFQYPVFLEPILFIRPRPDSCSMCLYIVGCDFPVFFCQFTSRYVFVHSDQFNDLLIEVVYFIIYLIIV